MKSDSLLIFLAWNTNASQWLLIVIIVENLWMYFGAVNPLDQVQRSLLS